MLKRKTEIFKLLGFTVSVDVSWGIILFLVVWSLAKGAFPAYYPNLSMQTYWIMGVIGALGLFLSIIIHEFSHSLVARKYGMDIKGITLFIFGGVAEMKDEPNNPKTEFFMAIAGPIASLILSMLFGILYQMATVMELPVPIIAILGYLSAINVLLAIFNMIPAFPTDGGRILRSILWWIKGDIRVATLVASRISVFFAMFIIFTGFMHLIQGNVMGGVWWILIGSFLFSAANSSYQSLLIKQSFAGKKVEDYMNKNPVTVPSHISLQEFVDQYLYPYHYKMFPVTQDGTISGLITLNALKSVPREKWPTTQVIQIMQKTTKDNTLPAAMSVQEAMFLMNESGISRMLVSAHHKIVGIITLKDMLEFFTLKIELEE
ncbi:site-2 protease family protein [Sulfurovum sp. zt1-1]|uniref:Zinc metalloprotease n=1 Tax=Sulfurovum zhangzhouensis TaxID=3019067 RepID=A0ABT7QXT2_9BACT|nr:site-2 protease family protein [Sulfurovum zhangzhouensis]MDM5271643.1 site-2 protease family protein [Sulfurovum zhangzhouensis]